MRHLSNRLKWIGQVSHISSEGSIRNERDIRLFNHVRFTLALLRELTFTQFHCMLVREAGKVNAISHHFDHCLAIHVNEICSIQSIIICKRPPHLRLYIVGAFKLANGRDPAMSCLTRVCKALEYERTQKQREENEMACRTDWYPRPLRRASRGRKGSASCALQFNPPVEPEECLLKILLVVFGSVHTQGPN